MKGGIPRAEVAFRRLDLDDLGAVVRQQHRAIRAREVAGQVQDQKMIESTCHDVFSVLVGEMMPQNGNGESDERRPAGICRPRHRAQARARINWMAPNCALADCRLVAGFKHLRCAAEHV